MRLFLAVPLAPVVLEELAAVSRRLRSPDDGLRWSSPESWHITLQFLGQVNPDQHECLTPRLHELRALPAAIQLEELDFFGRGAVFMIRASLTPSLLQLQQHIVAATQPCGFEPESRPYQPHVTLARQKGKEKVPLFESHQLKSGRSPKFTPSTAHEFLLFESFLGPTGSRYEIRERFPLHA
jgi:RNA 2',3'-cyclic 3'-phosphodiesterase